jgi:hypothetical protein
VSIRSGKARNLDLLTVLLVHLLYHPNVLPTTNDIIVERIERSDRYLLVQQRTTQSLFVENSLHNTINWSTGDRPAIFGPGNFANGLKYRR